MSGAADPVRKTVRLLSAALVVVLLLSSGIAFALHPLVSDDTGTQGPGGVLIESSVNYLKDGGYASTALPVAVTAGIGETMDLAVELPYLLLSPSPVTGADESGFSDAIFRFKHRFFEQERKQDGRERYERSLAYQVAYSPPTGSEEKGLGTGTARWGARLIGTAEWDAVEINANLGYESSGRTLRRGNFSFDNAVLLSVAAKYERPRPWEPVVELAAVQTKGTDVRTRIATVLFGLIFEPSENLYIDAGVRAGLNSRSEDYALLAGFGYKF
jgi:Putative MetA-pathway of phenol degradation